MSRKVCLVALDIRSSHNIGSLFRTCDGFSSELTLVGICPRPMSDSKNDDRLPHISRKADTAIAKTALGAEKTVIWNYYQDLDSALTDLRSQRYKIIAIEQYEKSKDLALINKYYKNENIALILGTEVTGIEIEDINKCDDVFEIPMNGKKESFNVSVAAAISLYEINR